MPLLKFGSAGKADFALFGGGTFWIEHSNVVTLRPVEHELPRRLFVKVKSILIFFTPVSEVGVLVVVFSHILELLINFRRGIKWHLG
jgi:hypothetical protein